MSNTVANAVRANGPINKRVFQAISDPGPPDTKLDGFGLSLRQTMKSNGHVSQIYTLTGFNGGPITPLSITVIDKEEMIATASWRNPATESTSFDYDRIFALVNEAHLEYPEASFPKVEGRYTGYQEPDDYGLEKRK